MPKTVTLEPAPGFTVELQFIPNEQYEGGGHESDRLFETGFLQSGPEGTTVFKKRDRKNEKCDSDLGRFSRSKKGDRKWNEEKRNSPAEPKSGARGSQEKQADRPEVASHGHLSHASMSEVAC